MFKPDIKLKRVTDITPELLREHGVDTLLLDVDNTLSTFKGTKFVDGYTEWRDMMLASGIKLRILSNAKSDRLAVFAKRAGLEGTGMAAKPLPFGYFRAAKQSGSKISATALAGDQIFTDVLGGNIAGVKTILLEPIELEKSWSFVLRRNLERKLLKRYSMSDGR